MDENALGVIGLLVFGVISLAFLAVMVWSIIWVYGDAEKRGRSGCLVALLVFLVGWPLSLILWVVARPEDSRPRHLDDGRGGGDGGWDARG